MWDLIVSVPGHCLSFYFGSSNSVESEAKHWTGFLGNRLQSFLRVRSQIRSQLLHGSGWDRFYSSSILTIYLIK